MGRPGGVFAVPVLDDQTIAVRFDFHTVYGKGFVHVLPTCCCLQRMNNLVAVSLGIGIKGLLTGVGFYQLCFLIAARLNQRLA